MKLVLLVALIAAVSVSADIWSNCGKPDDHFKIDTVQIVPDPPKINQNVTITASGTLDEEVTGGQLTLKVYYGPIKILDKTVDVCTVDPKDVPCPLKKGPYSRSITEMIPNSVPKGHYKGTFTMVDQNSQEVMCIALDFDLE